VVSEYADRTRVRCVKCDAALEVPKTERGGRLSVRQGGQRLVTKESRNTEVPDLEEFGSNPLADVYKKEKEQKSVNVLISWLAFLALAGLLVFLQTVVQKDPGMLGVYNWIRGISAGLIYLLVIVVAFEDHLWQGLLALVFLPYCLYYALIRLDARILRNLFLAVVVAFIAELKFIPEDAAITYAQTSVTTTINSLEGMIQRAGDAPTFN
jgi:hypothetical protein